MNCPWCGRITHIVDVKTVVNLVATLDDKGKLSDFRESEMDDHTSTSFNAWCSHCGKSLNSFIKQFGE